MLMVSFTCVLGISYNIRLCYNRGILRQFCAKLNPIKINGISCSGHFQMQ